MFTNHIQANPYIINRCKVIEYFFRIAQNKGFHIPELKTITFIDAVNDTRHNICLTELTLQLPTTNDAQCHLTMEYTLYLLVIQKIVTIKFDIIPDAKTQELPPIKIFNDIFYDYLSENEENDFVSEFINEDTFKKSNTCLSDETTSVHHLRDEACEYDAQKLWEIFAKYVPFA